MVTEDQIRRDYEKGLSYRELAKKYRGKELIKVYNNLHAQIVILAKKHCKKKPICKNCPIVKHCNFKEKSF